MLYAIIISAVLVLAGVGLVWFFRREGRRGAIPVSPPPVVFIPHHHRPPDVPVLVTPTGRGAAAGAPTSGAQPPAVARPPGPPVATAPATSYAGPGAMPQLVEIPVDRAVVVGADGIARHESGRPAGSGAGRAARSRRKGAGQPKGAGQALEGRAGRPGIEASGGASGGVSGGVSGGASVHRSVEIPATATMGTMRMLPGRFEVVEGHPTDREIRFVAEPGTADQQFTMGRGEGPPNRHVRLQGQTVSRLHAALSYRSGRWAIENLSATNPLRVNGREMGAGSEVVPLSDGDVVELGEVVLRFRT